MNGTQKLMMISDAAVSTPRSYSSGTYPSPPATTGGHPYGPGVGYAGMSVGGAVGAMSGVSPTSTRQEYFGHQPSYSGTVGAAAGAATYMQGPDHAASTGAQSHAMMYHQQQVIY